MQVNHVPQVKERILVMNGQCLIQQEQDGKWVTRKVEKAKTKPGLYNIYLSKPAEQKKIHEGLVVRIDDRYVYQQVQHGYVKHELSSFAQVPAAGSQVSILLEHGKTQVSSLKEQLQQTI